MKTFKDAAGRDWSIEINVAAVKRIKASELKLDLLSATDGKLILDLAEDPALLCDMLWLLVKSQAEAKAISDEQFGESLRGDAIDRAATAFLEELVDFFPSGKRQILAKMLARSKAYQERATARAIETLDGEEMTSALEDRLDQGVREAIAAARSTKKGEGLGARDERRAAPASGGSSMKPPESSA